MESRPIIALIYKRRLYRHMIWPYTRTKGPGGICFWMMENIFLNLITFSMKYVMETDPFYRKIKLVPRPVHGCLVLVASRGKQIPLQKILNLSKSDLYFHATWIDSRHTLSLRYDTPPPPPAHTLCLFCR